VIIMHMIPINDDGGVSDYPWRQTGPIPNLGFNGVMQLQTFKN
jgi:hypothetical protein